MNEGALPDFTDAFAGPIDFGHISAESSVKTLKDRDHWQLNMRQVMADNLYGDIPRAPDALRVSRGAIPGEKAERLEIHLTVGRRQFSVDAALWLPQKVDGPIPLICGLDFVGPAGVLTSQAFPLDSEARIFYRAEMGADDGLLTDARRGTTADQWPIDLLLGAGYAVIVSCYGSWTPDDPCHWKKHGVFPVFEQDEVSAISLWAWAISRLLDAAEQCDEIDPNAISVAGHSRLGKAALWAAANDQRIAGVFANQSGCGGAAPFAHPVGETLAQMAEKFPHWTRPNPTNGAYDQHHLLELLAPRAIYLSGAQSDLWSDPLGSYAALQAASDVWNLDNAHNWAWPPVMEIWETCGTVHNGPLGFHLRSGTHDLLPQDWQQFLTFVTPQ